MIVPGSNLLAHAMGPIARQVLQWHAWASRSTNVVGDFVSVFADPVPITGSMQPIARDAYQVLGLNLEKNYCKLYTTFDVKVMERDREGDLVEYAGKFWQCQSDTDWLPQDRWRKVICVEVPPPSEPA